MALQVWLPLDGRLDNLGIQSATVNNLGATISDDGKLGKGYAFTDGSTRLKIANPLTNNMSQFSIMAWVKITTFKTNNTNGLFGARSSGSGAGLLCSIGNTSFIFDDGTRYAPSYSGSANFLNKWVHVAFVKEPEFKCIYVNGTLIGRTENTSKTANIKNELTIGNDTFETYNGNGVTGILNDVRIYDHALSAKEIKEISKGLLVHYLFNRGQPNLLKLGGAERQCPSQSAHIAYYYFDFAGNLPAGTYTLSFDAKNNGSDNAYFSIAKDSSTRVRIGELKPGNTYYTHYSYTFTHNDTQVNNVFFTAYKDYGKPLNNNNTGILYIKNVKLENGTIETPFEVAESEGYSLATNFDTSGYSHNGTLSGTGDLVISNQTPRYQAALGFPSTLYYQVLSPTKDIRTLSFWAKWTNLNVNQSIICVDGNSHIGFGLVSNGILTSTGTSSISFDARADLVLNQWYHFVVVCPEGSASATRQLYCNGVEITARITNSTWSYGNSYLYIGKRPQTADGFNGYLSDFRCYVTALSAADVLELYQTSMEIDVNGNILPRILTT